MLFDMSLIPVKASYLEAIGTAFYNFAYLEWIVIWTVEKLLPGSISKLDGEKSPEIIEAFSKAINTTSPALQTDLRNKLNEFKQHYEDVSKLREQLLTAHPFTASGDVQELSERGHEWPIQFLTEIATLSENAAIAGNGIFYEELAKARP